MKLKKFQFRALCPEITSTTYSTHGLHSYVAKFIPQMPRYFIKKYCVKGDVVLDPFCGSGTTLLEANILNTNAYGIDINPLARLIAKVKTHPIAPARLSNATELLLNELKRPIKLTYDVDFPNKEYWFNRNAITQLKKIFTAIENLKSRGDITDDIYDYFRVCVSSIIRKSSYADPTNPKTYCSPRMNVLRKKQVPTFPLKYFKEALDEANQRMTLLYALVNSDNTFTKFISTNDATDIQLNDKVDLIITSPPYANAQEYFRNIKLELFWLKLANNKMILELDKRQIGGENHAAINYRDLHLTKLPQIDNIIRRIYVKDKKRAYIVYKYFYNMDKFIFECSRVLKKGKHFIIIIGNNSVRGNIVPIHQGLLALAKNHGFKLCELGYDLIRNRKLMTFRNNNAKPIDRDWVIDLVKK